MLKIIRYRYIVIYCLIVFKMLISVYIIKNKDIQLILLITKKQ